MRGLSADLVARSLVGRFVHNRRASSAVEFAIIAAPFMLAVMGVIQVGIFYMAQSALDTGTAKTAETLRTNFTTGATATLLSAGQLKSSVASSAGAMISNDSTLLVEIRQLSSLSTATVAIADGTVDYGTAGGGGTAGSTLVLRAQSSVVTLAPGLSGLNTIYSSALVRRQGT
jgi:Flp pilus assembly protein TadG